MPIYVSRHTRELPPQETLRGVTPISEILAFLGLSYRFPLLHSLLCKRPAYSRYKLLYRGWMLEELAHLSEPDLVETAFLDHLVHRHLAGLD